MSATPIQNDPTWDSKENYFQYLLSSVIFVILCGGPMVPIVWDGCGSQLIWKKSGDFAYGINTLFLFVFLPGHNERQGADLRILPGVTL